MRTLAHLSDLHFGTEDPQMVEALITDVNEFHPSLVVISGDLTQRARKREFVAARSFLNRISSPYLVVPGNHDVPLFNVARRFFRPLERYKTYISENTDPTFEDEELIVVGLNSARSATIKGGRISKFQMKQIEARFCSVDSGRFKILVSHHPFLPPENVPSAALVGRIGLVLNHLERCGVDMILCGHFHLSYAGDIRRHHLRVQRSILAAQAGTALSHRLRAEPNSYNRVTIDPPRVDFQLRAWNGASFADTRVINFQKISDEWLLEKPGK